MGLLIAIQETVEIPGIGLCSKVRFGRFMGNELEIRNHTFQFDRPPRNPAEKISSGYKAWEFLTYVFGLGPGVFLDILLDIYWTHFCKLVAGIRLLYQCVIMSA